MTECPVCGHRDVSEKQRPYQELWKERIFKIFGIHLEKTWWLKQPEYVCQWLKEIGIIPQSIVDVGCGDGRWLPGILTAFPGCGYVGVDRVPEHISQNKERFPEVEWVLHDFPTWDTNRSFDMALIGGTLNPIMAHGMQTNLLNKVLGLSPKWILCLFDRFVGGRAPDGWINKDYKKISTLAVPKDLSGDRQDIVVWLYERTHG